MLTHLPSEHCIAHVHNHGKDRCHKKKLFLTASSVTPHLLRKSVFRVTILQVMEGGLNVAPSGSRGQLLCKQLSSACLGTVVNSKGVGMRCGTTDFFYPSISSVLLDTMLSWVMYFLGMNLTFFNGRFFSSFVPLDKVIMKYKLTPTTRAIVTARASGLFHKYRSNTDCILPLEVQNTTRG